MGSIPTPGTNKLNDLCAASLVSFGLRLVARVSWQIRRINMSAPSSGEQSLSRIGYSIRFQKSMSRCQGTAVRDLPIRSPVHCLAAGLICWLIGDFSGQGRIMGGCKTESCMRRFWEYESPGGWMALS